MPLRLKIKRGRTVDQYGRELEYVTPPKSRYESRFKERRGTKPFAELVRSGTGDREEEHEPRSEES